MVTLPTAGRPTAARTSITSLTEGESFYQPRLVGRVRNPQVLPMHGGTDGREPFQWAGESRGSLSREEEKEVVRSALFVNEQREAEPSAAGALHPHEQRQLGAPRETGRRQCGRQGHVHSSISPRRHRDNRERRCQTCAARTIRNAE